MPTVREQEHHPTSAAGLPSYRFDIVEIVSNPYEIWGEGVLLFVVFHSLSFALSFVACWGRCGALNSEREWYLISSISVDCSLLFGLTLRC